MIRPDVVWKYDGVSYTDLTSNIKTTSTFDFISSTSDIFYIGLNRRFTGLMVNVGTAGSYTGLTISAYDGENWTQVEEIYDYDFDVDKYSLWNLPTWAKFNFTDTDPHSATPPDNNERYWIKISATGVTTQATIEKVRCIPHATYCNVSDVAGIIGLPTRDWFGPNTQPLTEDEVEDFINRIESQIDYELKQSWRFNIIEEEFHEFNISGFQLENRDIIDVYSLKIWDGSGWETKEHGRTNDYFYVSDTGMVYFARYFMMPARLAFTGPHWWGWGIGEFTFPVKVNYSYGKDWEKDQKFRGIQKLAAKMTAVEIMDATNYLAVIPEGVRGIDLATKTERWKMEIEQQLDSYKPMWIF